MAAWCTYLGARVLMRVCVWACKYVCTCMYVCACVCKKGKGVQAGMYEFDMLSNVCRVRLVRHHIKSVLFPRAFIA